MREAEYAKRVNVINLTANYSLSRKESGSLITNVGASGTITVNLPTTPEAGDRYLFTLGAAQVININPADTHQLVVGGTAQTAGKYIGADDEAESIEFVYVGNSKWLARNTVGTWTVEA